MPTVFAQFSWLKGLSVLIPSTWVLAVSKSPMRLSKAGMQVLEPDGLQREVGRRVADIEGLALGGGTHLSCPPFAILRVAGVMIARRSPTFAGALRAAAHACGRRLSSGASARPR